MQSVTPTIHDNYTFSFLSYYGHSFFFAQIKPARDQIVYRNEFYSSVKCYNGYIKNKVLNIWIRSTLFSSKKSFTQLLPSLLNQQIFVEQISQHLTSSLELFDEFGLIFLQNLASQSVNIKPIIVLTSFNTCFVEYLADNEKKLKDVDEARSIMFSYCLKVRNLSIYSNTVSFCKRENLFTLDP